MDFAAQAAADQSSSHSRKISDLPEQVAIHNGVRIPYRLITDRHDLAIAAEDLAGRERIAVDLEADSMFHFQEKVCLIQIAVPEYSLVLDPLQIGDLSPLGPIFQNPRIQKILHGADYDVRSLKRDYGFTIHSLFDTELACRFLGFTESGLNAVLQKMFDVKLEKKFQKMDWSQRPLPEEMIHYALLDAFYLISLSTKIAAMLEARGLLDWVMEESAELSRVNPIARDENGPLFVRVKGAGKLDRRSLAVLEALLKFRMHIAARRNRPVFKVIGNNELTNLALARPQTLEDLQALHILSQNQINQYGRDIVACIGKALKIPEEQLPRYPRQKRSPGVTVQATRRANKLKEWRDKKAETLGIEGSLILNKAMMMEIAQVNPSTPAELESIQGLKKWQMDAFGGDIVRALKRS
jgi:ribonuclease D